MKQERSAGTVVYYKGPEKLYLILHNAAGHWDFPKGKIESGETLQEAALRETKEETGLDVNIVDKFEQTISYYYKDRSGELVSKTVVFFVAEAKFLDVTLSREHLHFKWVTFEEALNTLSFANGKQLLKMADQFLMDYQRVEHRS